MQGKERKVRRISVRIVTGYRGGGCVRLMSWSHGVFLMVRHGREDGKRLEHRKKFNTYILVPDLGVGSNPTQGNLFP